MSFLSLKEQGCSLGMLLEWPGVLFPVPSGMSTKSLSPGISIFQQERVEQYLVSRLGSVPEPWLLAEKDAGQRAACAHTWSSLCFCACVI